MRVGIDIGGTFTDTIIYDDDTGKLETLKLPTTPNNPEKGVENSLHKAFYKGISPHDISHIAHACTIATNSIIERKGARVALFTTAGFEDILELGKMRRPDPYDFLQDIPQPLVPRRLVRGVPERINSKGDVVTELDEQKTMLAIDGLKGIGIEAFTVSLLFSFLNPTHEQLVKKLILSKFPQAHITLSSDLIPIFREYERTSTTVVNSYVAPRVSRYITDLERSLNNMSIEPDLYIMRSSGGVMSTNTAKTQPAHIIESGPAAGVIEAAYLGSQMGFKDIITFDMGGTTAKMGIIRNGLPEITSHFEVGAIARSSQILTGTGYPVMLPVIDLCEIGAGGGSIAWIDSGNLLRVGPQSAGSDPAPVCYGKGGTEPTVTDANLVLGYLNADFFLGGDMKLDKEGAYSAIEEKIANKLGIDVIAAALGIIEISNANMIRGLKVVTTSRGFDPREFAMMAFGGAGPCCAAELAFNLQIPQVIVPATASVHSALGLLSTDIRHDFVATNKHLATEIDVQEMNGIFNKFSAEGITLLEKERVNIDDVVTKRSADMRYSGQSYEINIPFREGEINNERLSRLVEDFHDAHERIYAHTMPGHPVEVVALRQATFGVSKKPDVKIYDMSDSDEPGHAIKDARDVYYSGVKTFLTSQCYDGARLLPGNEVSGPAIIEMSDTTIVIPPEQSAKVDKYRNIIISTPG